MHNEIYWSILLYKLLKIEWFYIGETYDMDVWKLGILEGTSSEMQQQQ